MTEHHQGVEMAEIQTGYAKMLLWQEEWALRTRLCWVPEGELQSGLNI